MYDDDSGPQIKDFVTFLCGCPKICRTTETLRILSLSCLCVSHFLPLMSAVRIGSAISSTEGPELSEII